MVFFSKSTQAVADVAGALTDQQIDRQEERQTDKVTPKTHTHPGKYYQLRRAVVTSVVVALFAVL